MGWQVVRNVVPLRLVVHEYVVVRLHPRIVVQYPQGNDCNIARAVEVRHFRAAYGAECLGEMAGIGHLVVLQMLLSRHEAYTVQGRLPVGGVGRGAARRQRRQWQL